MDREVLITLTADIASAYVGNNPSQVSSIPHIIHSVARALESALVAPAPASKLTPAVEIRRSITARSVTCLDCGRVMKSLKQHLRLAHSLSPSEYRTRWGLKPDSPIVAPDYSERRKKIALDHSLGQKK